jgi:putative peptide zinc metalloprotease protein
VKAGNKSSKKNICKLTRVTSKRNAGISLAASCESELSAQMGGHVLVREKAGQLTPERAIYHVTFKPAKGAQVPAAMQAMSWRGQVSIQAEAESPALRYLRRAAAVLVQEFGF